MEKEIGIFKVIGQDRVFAGYRVICSADEYPIVKEFDISFEEKEKEKHD